MTALRIAATPVIVSLIIRQDLLLAAGLTVLAGISDVADGYIARRFPSQKSVLGSYLDPVADKLFVSLLGASLAYTGLFPGSICTVNICLVSLFALFLTRDVLLLAGASYVRFISLRPPRSLGSVVYPKEPVIEMKPTACSKLNTAVQITTVLSSLMAPTLDLSNCTAIQAMWLLAACTTMYSGADYARRFSAVYNEALRMSSSKL
ncbi:unnamed protein product [Mesocestoides corti]|uniref:cardiolipin synthase (CMP-forming) n=1 Tax=Mesocestoides corti TaxID=53468 RepID=A0A3P6HK54_MESCO|nr:unnamed protein product [Mesocestoides corti]